MFQILAIVCTLLLGLLTYIKKRNTTSKLPGPKGIPVFGNLFQLELERLYLIIHRMSLRFGEIFQLDILGQKLICLNSSSIIRDVFLREPNATICAARPPTFVGKYVFENYSDIGFASIDKRWTRHRKILSMQVKACSQEEILKCLRLTKAELKSITEQSVCPHDIIEEFILNSVETLMIGRFYGRNGELQKLLKKLDHNLNTLGNMGKDLVYSILPFLRFLPLHNSYVLKECTEQKLQLMEILKNTAKDNPEYRGIYQCLMEYVDKKEDAKTGITETNVRCLCVDIVGAAYVTTRGTLLSAVHILATRPELQKSLQEEIDTVIGRKREPTLKDREHCPLLESVLLETLRYISHVPLSVAHYTSDSCIINGYNIDKGTIILPNLYSAHHNPNVWEKPFEFLPERFLDHSGRLLPATALIRKSVLAFGSGKRSCMGELFSKSRMFLFMSTLMQTVTIEKPDDVHLPEFNVNDLEPGIALQPRQYKVKFVLRK